MSKGEIGRSIHAGVQRSVGSFGMGQRWTSRKILSFENGDFYYRSYNNKYLAIDTVGSCNEELRLSIEDFNEDDVFYTYGKINFLKDFYQKLASKSYSVRDKCASLEQSKELQE